MREMMRKNWLALIGYTLIVSVIAAPWFFSKGCLFFTDLVVGPAEMPLAFFERHFILRTLLTSLSAVLSICTAQKLIILAAVALLLFAGRLITRHLVENKALIFVVSLFFLFDPFVYDRLLYGQIGVVYAFGFLAAACGYLISYIRTGALRDALFTGLFMGLSLQFSLHFLFIGALIGFSLLVVRFIEHKNAKEVILHALIIGSVVFAVNANWIAGMAMGNSGVATFVSEGISTEDLTAFQTAGETGGEALLNVLMMSGFWGKDQFRYLDLTKSEGWERAFLFLLPLIVWGAYSGLKNKETRRLVWALIAVFIAAVALAVGVRVLIAREITELLFEYMPFYKGMRETQKWTALIVIVYGVFLSLGLKELFKRRFFVENRTVASMFIGGVIVAQAPLLLWGFGGQVRPAEYPADWYEVDELIVQESGCSGKTLFLPWHMYMSFNWIGNIVANPANKFFTCPVIQGTNMEFGGIYDNSTRGEGAEVKAWLDSQGATDLLADTDLNIRYIVLAKEVDWQAYAWLETMPTVEKVKETRTLVLYEVR